MKNIQLGIKSRNKNNNTQLIIMKRDRSSSTEISKYTDFSHSKKENETQPLLNPLPNRSVRIFLHTFNSDNSRISVANASLENLPSAAKKCIYENFEGNFVGNSGVRRSITAAQHHFKERKRCV